MKFPLSVGIGILKLKTRSILGLKSTCRYRNFSIRLPAGHLLPFYQALHATYDRFLPHLVRHLETDATVIDVGANCGDTLAAMYDANDSLAYICVEPDESFFGYLAENAMNMRRSGRNAKIRLYQNLVGRNVSQAALAGHGGTKHAVMVDAVHPGINAMSAVTLDSLVLPIESGRVDLLKSDVDGFDFDVLDSATQLIAEHLPIIFFECHFRDSNQKKGYENTIAVLQRSGDRAWTIFDNFGDVVLRTTQIEDLFQLFDYIERQNAGRATRTIHYFDVMATTERHMVQVSMAVSDYLEKTAALAR